ncbi:MAG: hypothetical protein ACLPID_13490 [Beijerinckiaceae bacterium]
MFGMLDYRAHKLLWLLLWPFTILTKLTFFAVIAAAIIIAQNTAYSTVVKVVIAYVVCELMLAVVSLIVLASHWMFKAVFFWLIDVIPAHGSTPEEAHAIALRGRATELALKWDRDISNWTAEDTHEYVSLMNWRARLFFGGRIRTRMQRVTTELRRIFADTGTTPTALGVAGVVEAQKRVPGGEVSWFEQALVSQHIFNSIVAIILIVLVIAYAPQHGL